jgi:hypothetical protein
MYWSLWIEVYQIVREKGGVTISDEVQCGFGRMGTHYWGFQTQDVIPDIGTLSPTIFFISIDLPHSLSLLSFFYYFSIFFQILSSTSKV